MIQLILFCEFFKIGLFTIGGGYAMLPLIQNIVVKKYQWMSLDQFAEFVGISESTPGPFAVNVATFSGMYAGGFWGSVAATLGAILPSLLCILLIAAFFNKAIKNPSVKNAMRGAKPVVTGLLAASAIELAYHSIFNAGEFDLKVFIFFVISMLLLQSKLKFSPWQLILTGAIAGMIFF